MNAEVRQSYSAAIEFLLNSQKENGSWCDYFLDVGESNSWITAYVLCNLGLTKQPSLEHESIKKAIKKAVNFLVQNQALSGGWGYNEHVMQDCDSTAYAIIALRLHGITPNMSAVNFVQKHQLGNGWFSTFKHKHANHPWSFAHPEVSAVSLIALNDKRQAQRFIQTLKDEIKKFGYITSFWWNDSIYSTYVISWMAEYFSLLNLIDFLPTDENPNMGFSVFRLALLGMTSYIFEQKSIVNNCLELILNLQQNDGSWEPSAELRQVSDNSGVIWCVERKSIGPIYLDIYKIFTTATAIRFLSRYLADPIRE